MQKMVNYETPVGLFGEWEEAAAACERADLDPCECIKSVPIQFVDTCIEHAYGSAVRLPFQVRVF